MNENYIHAGEEFLDKILYIALCIFLFLVPIFNFMLNIRGLHLYLNIIFIFLMCIPFTLKYNISHKLYIHQHFRNILFAVIAQQIIALFYIEDINTFLRIMQLDIPILFFILLMHIPYSSIQFSLSRCNHLLIFSTTIGSCYSLYNYIHHLSFNGFKRLTHYILEDPNAYANFLVIVMGITLYQMLKDKYKYSLLYCISILINTITLFFTYSRGGFVQYLVFIIVVSFLFVIKYVKKNKMFYLSAMICIGIFILALSSDYIITRFIYERNWSILSRFHIWKQAIQNFIDAPLFGIGLGNFWYKEETIDSAHNIYLQILAEGGLIGTLIYCVFFTYLYKYTNRIKNKENTLLNCTLFAYMISQIFDSNFLVIQTNWIIYFILLLKLENETIEEKPAIDQPETEVSQKV